MGRALEAECGAFDLVHLHSVYLWPTWAAARSARRAGIPYLLAPRGMLVKELIERKSALVKKAWIGFIERRNIEHAAGIHVTSVSEGEDLRRFGFRLPAVYEVPNGVATGGDGESAEALPRHVLDIFESDRPVILSLGRIHWKKGLDRLIGALAHVPEALLLVVGNDEEDYTPRLKKLAADAGVSGRVIFAKPVFGAARAALYRKVALFALPSYSENFGNVVLEAMAEGCPVVVTPEVGASAVVEEAGGGIVATGELAPFADALRRLLSDARLRGEMGIKGREWVRERYSWDRVAERMVDVYRLLITARGARGVA
jgi:glycosyltransferase involved in cell wall biosynthesis